MPASKPVDPSRLGAHQWDIHEPFWKGVLALDGARDVCPFDVLARRGLDLPPPEQLDDAQLIAKLWDVIHAMADVGIVLEFTDHLSDRELYGYLCSDVLREPIQIDEDDIEATWHIDLTGSGAEDDTQIFLKYYADDDYRRRWAADFPDYPMPDCAPLPFDRDRHLP
jgi:hypothetical protein